MPDCTTKQRGRDGSVCVWPVPQLEPAMDEFRNYARREPSPDNVRTTLAFVFFAVLASALLGAALAMVTATP